MADNPVKQAIRNFKYAFLAQLCVFVLGIAKSLILPAFYNEVSTYGYWQLYLLYTGYVGICTLGFNDGIYLRYGQYQFEDLPHGKLRSAIRINMLVLGMFTTIFLVLILLTSQSAKAFSLSFAAINIFIMGINGTLIYIFQITNQIKKYSFFSIADKIGLMTAIFIIIIANEQNYRVLIVIDVLIKSLVVIGMIFSSKELWIGKTEPFKEVLKEYLENINVGYKLMLANFMGIMISGIGRIIVEKFGSIEEYAYYSFASSAANMVLIFITAISLVMYPTIKRLSESNYSMHYKKIDNLLRCFSMIMILAYFPANILIINYLQKYIPALKYLNILFGIVVVQSKNQLLNNTFYKVLREEKAMLKANMSSVVSFTVLALILFITTRSVWTIAFSMLLIMAFRCYLSEFYLCKKMNVRVGYTFLYEIIAIIIFVIVTSTMDLSYAAFVYILYVMAYGIKNYAQIKEVANVIRR